jgi:predicted metal-dependent hydrolase
VTIPRRGSQREAERFLLAQHAWIDRQRASLVERLAKRPPRTWANGHQVLVRGVALVVRWGFGSAPGEQVRLHEDSLVVWARDPDASGDLRGIVTMWLWRLARVELPARLRTLAAQQNLDVKAVSVRNQRTRWGSCAPNGRISLNWRLVQTPDAVRDYVLIHELMHLRQGNHSKRFWRLVAAACPGYQSARQWLKGHERLLLDA